MYVSQNPKVNPQTNLSLSRVLSYTLEKKPWIFKPKGLTEAPTALFYDLDAYEYLLDSCVSAFGPNFKHYIAAKANPLLSMLGYAINKGMGIECASIGELLLAYETLGCADVVFDSPAKTERELKFVIEQNIKCHLDNFYEYERAKYLVSQSSTKAKGLGFRINPSNVGAGTIAALSVSTPDSKFGVDATNQNIRDALLAAYTESTWLDSIHVHVGSGGMEPESQLAAGVRFALDLALEINQRLGYNQIKTIDIGGGLPVNYASDDFSSQNVPTFYEYAQVLRKITPELFEPDRFQVITEFGQSLNAKAGFLASSVEFVKKESSRSNNLAIVHFGADICLRQAYANQDHPRRFAAFDNKSALPLPHNSQKIINKPWSLGGPLCFAGDVLARDLDLPSTLQPEDIIVMKDAGANTLSLFSRHCSRLAPPVFGFRWHTDAPSHDPQISHFALLKPRETIRDLEQFWGKPPSLLLSAENNSESQELASLFTNRQDNHEDGKEEKHLASSSS